MQNIHISCKTYNTFHATYSYTQHFMQTYSLLDHYWFVTAQIPIINTKHYFVTAKTCILIHYLSITVLVCHSSYTNLLLLSQLRHTYLLHDHYWFVTV
jgi:hypothetical protein